MLRVVVVTSEEEDSMVEQIPRRMPYQLPSGLQGVVRGHRAVLPQVREALRGVPYGQRASLADHEEDLFLHHRETTLLVVGVRRGRGRRGVERIQGE